MSVGPPLEIRVRLIHGVLERIAQGAGVDLLHIKGPAVHDELLDTTTEKDPKTGEEKVVRHARGSSDADILVRPEHVDAFLAAARRAGWECKTSFTSGSAFGHALNLYHPRVGNADVHRHFPGLPERSFSDVWHRRGTKVLGHVPCSVPSLTAQRLILLLHAARSGPGHVDTRRAWGRASDAEREDLRRLAKLLGAELGMSAALGELDRFRDHPDYLLWKHFAEGNTSRLDEWRGRWRAATTMRAKAIVIKNFVVFDESSLESDLGHAPSRSEVRTRRLRRWSTMFKEVKRVLSQRGKA